MSTFDPYFAARLLLSFLFFGLILHDVIGVLVWYRQLPGFVQKLILLKLLQLRSPAIKRECALVLGLLSIQGLLMAVLLQGDN